ncbi:hypothetical protein [Pseudoalteromonas sp. S1688]|uniref:hypothetical protein n=1 Tax=Pseudoalteromonas sp. S1688 TaxID=579511 RepID=UPI00110A90CC|nr:hypothetical protein [Pseudoalteromonas sp. S1688]TMP53582.1 hypothetical protein CWB81_00050 [Pseudoalteromonas sp. S1688]
MKIFDPSIHINLSSQNSQLDEFVFLDIEASGLGFNSYPIEVAYATSNDETASALIKPNHDWLESGEWDSNAERNIHKITQHVLLEQGKSAKAVAAELNSALKGKLIFCNDLAYDGVWLAKLFKVADVGVEFFLTDIRAFFDFIGKEKTSSYKSAYEDISVETIHRALPDALRFVSAYKLVSGH